MCLAVPGKVIGIDGKVARIDYGGTIREANISLVEAKVGEYVIVHAGYAIQKMSETEAKETLDLFAEILEAGKEASERDREGK